MRVRQQSTATYHVPLYMVSSTDHITPQTGKTVSVTLSKNSAAFGAASGAVTEVSSGVYKLAANATDTDTLGSLVVLATATGCDPYLVEYTVVAFDPFSAASLGLTNLDAAISTRSTLDGTGVQTALTAQGYTTTRAGYLDTLNGLVAAIWDKATSAITAVGSIGKQLKDNLDTTVGSRMATFSYTAPPSVTDIRTEMDANSTKLANLDAAVTTRLASASYTAPLSGAQTAAAVLDAVAADYNDAGSIGEAINDAATAGGASAADIADAVWDEATAGHATAGSTGAALTAAGNAGDPWAAVLPGAYTGNQAGAQLPAIKAKTDTLSGTSITITSPVVDASTVQIVRGDDYKNADGRALFAGTTFSNAPSLSGGTVTLKVQKGSTTFTKAGVVTGAATCYVELTTAETAALPTGKPRFDLEAALANSDIVTIAQGTLEVLKDVR